MKIAFLIATCWAETASQCVQGDMLSLLTDKFNQWRQGPEADACIKLIQNNVACLSTETKEQAQQKVILNEKYSFDPQMPETAKVKFRAQKTACSKLLGSINKYQCNATQKKYELQRNIKYWSVYTVRDKSVKEAEVSMIN